VGRISLKSDCDELGTYIHKRNIVCSRNLLEALTANHGVPEDVQDNEPEPVAEPEPPAPEIVLIPSNKIELIKRSICKHYGLTRANIESASRKSVVVRPRQIAMYLARKHTDHSYPEIGRRFGGRDHTTILHAFHKIEGLIARDAAMAATVADLEAAIS
jgi:hypothetical protein